MDANEILLSMLISGIGFVALVYGKRQSRLPQMVAGFVLMAYPYFVSNLWAMGGIAVGVIVAMVIAIRVGL